MNKPSPERHLLSKSTYMMGRQCPKRLWLYKKQPELRADLSTSQEMVFERGTDVGELARDLFPEGKDASPVDFFHYPEAIQQTFDWIQAGETVIYEAAFQFDRVLAALDILVKKNGKWYAYEVKSSTGVKDQYLADVALQYYVMTNSGLLVEDISIIHLNKEYVRKGALDIKKLFTIVSVMKEIQALQKEIPQKIVENKNILQLIKEPTVDIGSHCTDPYDCEFIDYCWSHIPEVSVFDLSNLRNNKKFELYYMGVLEFHQLPGDYSLTTAQELQVRAFRENYTHTELKMLQKWLRQLKYPLCFMDFETFMPGVPLYDNSNPYQQIPFQFSVHIQEEPGSQLKHYSYLGEPEIDPRPEFVKKLVEVTNGNGSILVYNTAFESTRLKELQKDIPEYSDKIVKILSRIIDLMEPFKKKWYYTREMNGSYSIKSVLPALISDLSYDGLEIGEGGTAMAAFEGLLKIAGEQEKQKIRNALLEYCKLDTLAMTRILDKLIRLK